MKKKLLASLLSSTILATTFISPNFVFADGLDEELKSAQSELEVNEQEQDKLNQLISNLTGEVTSTKNALSKLNSEISKNENALKDAQVKLEKANKEMKKLIKEIEALEENIEKRAIKLDEQARKIQVNGSSANYLEYILDSDSLTDIMARIDVVSTIIRTSNSMIDDQIKDKEAVNEKSEETERKIVKQNELAEELENKTADLELQQVTQEALVAQLEIEKNQATDEKDSLVAARNSALQRVEQINNEREEIRAAVATVEEERVESENTSEETSVSVASSNQENNPTSTATGSQESQTTPASGNNSNSGNTTSDSRPNQSSTNTGSSNSGGSSSSNSTSTPSKPKPKPEAPAPAPSGNVISVANKYLGTPYLWGGTTTSGFDCSGFTRQVFSEVGKSIPRNSAAQYSAATKISNPRPGDLVFFGRGSVTHVGIYTGNGQFVGSQTSTGVAYTTVSSFSKFGAPLIGYGRY